MQQLEDAYKADKAVKLEKQTRKDREEIIWVEYCIRHEHKGMSFHGFTVPFSQIALERHDLGGLKPYHERAQ